MIAKVAAEEKEAAEVVAQAWGRTNVRAAIVAASEALHVVVEVDETYVAAEAASRHYSKAVHWQLYSVRVYP